MTDHPKEDEARLLAMKRRLDALQPEEKGTDHSAHGASRYGTEFISGVIVGFFIGYGLDEWLQTEPVFMLIGLFLGVAAGGWNIYKLAISQQENSEDGV